MGRSPGTEDAADAVAVADAADTGACCPGGAGLPLPSPAEGVTAAAAVAANDIVVVYFAIRPACWIAPLCGNHEEEIWK